MSSHQQIARVTLPEQNIDHAALMWKPMPNHRKEETRTDGRTNNPQTPQSNWLTVRDQACSRRSVLQNSRWCWFPCCLLQSPTPALTVVEGDGRGTWMSLICVSETGTVLPCFSLLMRVSCAVTTNVISIKKLEQGLNRKGRKHATTGRVDILRRSPTPFQDALAIVQSPKSLVLVRASCVAMQNLVDAACHLVEMCVRPRSLFSQLSLPSVTTLVFVVLFLNFRLFPWMSMLRRWLDFMPAHPLPEAQILIQVWSVTCWF